MLRKAVTEPVDAGRLKCSSELRACVGRMVEVAPDARFATPAELLTALAATPEAAVAP
jgi:hypothetical protein